MCSWQHGHRGAVGCCDVSPETVLLPGTCQHLSVPLLVHVHVPCSAAGVTTRRLLLLWACTRRAVGGCALGGQHSLGDAGARYTPIARNWLPGCQQQRPAPYTGPSLFMHWMYLS
jgi:hypothetical protein